jgi:hypothetical protein
MSDHGHVEIDQAEARLRALEERIRSLEDRLAAAEQERGPRFVDSGTVHRDLDDQTIAP